MHLGRKEGSFTQAAVVFCVKKSMVQYRKKGAQKHSHDFEAAENTRSTRPHILAAKGYQISPVPPPKKISPKIRLWGVSKDSSAKISN